MSRLELYLHFHFSVFASDCDLVLHPGSHVSVHKSCWALDHLVPEVPELPCHLLPQSSLSSLVHTFSYLFSRMLPFHSFLISDVAPVVSFLLCYSISFFFSLSPPLSVSLLLSPLPLLFSLLSLGAGADYSWICQGSIRESYVMSRIETGATCSRL